MVCRKQQSKHIANLCGMIRKPISRLEPGQGGLTTWG